ISVGIILLTSMGMLKVPNNISGNISLASVEALASSENDGDNKSWTQPQTVSCRLDLGNSWFTASVERQCVFVQFPIPALLLIAKRFFY
ncbi:MAG: hypothetical protein LUD15_04650, partial [Bacteroides sp.]|nr:hypothetical protein [Bacteroides sp.]